MSSYRGTADRPDQAKAIAAVVAVHVALAVLILTGLNVSTVRRAVEQLTTIDIKEPPPPPPVPPPKPASKPQQAKKPAGAPAPKAQPTPVVAPVAKLPVPSPIPAAKIAGTGSASSSGAGTSGTGTGAGGSGSGPGGGGHADYSRFSPPRLVSPLRNRDYQMLTANRLPTGSGDVAIVIAPNGRISNCRVIRSSGDSFVDSGLCPLIVSRLYFSPARDDQGRPIAYSTNFHAQWSLRW
jgi:periplasmic protein TonB